MKPLLPYPTFGDTATLEVVSVAVDGRNLPYSQISKTDHVVALHEAERGSWQAATLQLKALLPDQASTDPAWTDIVCLAVLSESATNARTSARLTRQRDGSWQGEIELVRGRHSSRAVLSLAVVAEVGGVAGRAIGESTRPWYVDLKESAPRRQRQIKVVQVDFREGPEEWLRPFKDSTWVVDTVNDDIPTVYLNTAAVEGLIAIYNGSGGSAAEKVLREMAASQTAQDVWTAMFHTSVSHLDEDEDGTPIMPTGWKESVLRMMLPDVLPGRQLTDALHEINDRRTSGDGWPDLQTNIQYAAGKRSQIARKLTTAVRTAASEERTGF
ncbi:hypothetical protein [Lentzea sp. NPDC003310]|uniref:hypothetical protein n=1 Tax=Lentzea sp. NPDC003310 TaxID=3154447 RepID=UPI0033AA419F